jgi:spore coat polysaccharide biosynthesis predicted glycosyltransferase SpsG
MRIIFRVDASLQMGTGHVMRCLTLAEILKENGANVEFICRKHKGNLIDKIRSNGFNVFELELPAVNEVDNKLVYCN